VDLTSPLLSVSPDTHGRVLSVLIEADRPLSGNAIARRSGLSDGGAWPPSTTSSPPASSSGPS
jgi:hypothetical protein